MVFRHHPYKAPAPAGIRIADYFPSKLRFSLFRGTNLANARSPASSPFSNPVRGACHAEDDAPPTLRLADLFTRNGVPTRPSAPAPGQAGNAVPNPEEPNVFARDNIPTPRRKVKHGPKHISFTRSGKVRPETLPPLRRAQQMKDKRGAARKSALQRHESLLAPSPTDREPVKIGNLRRAAEKLMKPKLMNKQDKVFMLQLRNLQVDDKLALDLERCRQRIARAKEQSKERRREHKERDKAAAKLRKEVGADEAKEEQRKMVQAFVQAHEENIHTHYRKEEEEALRIDEERQRAHDAMERKIREEQERLLREELARKAKEEEERRREELERRRREELERRRREEEARRLYEEIERVRREAHARFARQQRERQEREMRDYLAREERERLLREDAERMRRQAREQFVQEENERLARAERERQARLLAEQEARRAAMEEQLRQFSVYEAKWNELRSNAPLPAIDVREMPWPVFGTIFSANQITYEAVRLFLFHPLRPGVEGKTTRDKVKSEVLRFHPDKFNTRIVPKIHASQQAVAQEIAGAVARILTRILTEEEANQK